MKPNSFDYKMPNLSLREPSLLDADPFLLLVKESHDFHSQWCAPPDNLEKFKKYFNKFQQPTYKSFFLILDETYIVGVFNIFDITKGCFQNSYIGYYCFKQYAHQGYMSKGLKLVLEKVFNTLNLHRIEADIEPHNFNSKNLVKANNFIFEGLSKNFLKINGIWKDHERWALTYEDWKRFQ